MKYSAICRFLTVAQLCAEAGESCPEGRVSAVQIVKLAEKANREFLNDVIANRLHTEHPCDMLAIIPRDDPKCPWVFNGRRGGGVSTDYTDAGFPRYSQDIPWVFLEKEDEPPPPPPIDTSVGPL